MFRSSIRARLLPAILGGALLATGAVPAHAAETATALPVQIAAASSGDVTTDDQVFLDRTFDVNVGAAGIVIAGAGDGTGTWGVDDQIDIEITRPDGTKAQYMRNFEFQPPADPVKLSSYTQPGRNQLHVTMRDTFGVYYGSTDVWLTSGAKPAPTGPVVSDTVAQPSVGASVAPRTGSTADIFTATVLGLCPSGSAPTFRVGTVAENYEIPIFLAAGGYENSTDRVVLVDQRVRGGATTLRFKAAMPGVAHVYVFCGNTQVGVAAFTVRGMAYAALGDSYSSGEGAAQSQYLAGTNTKNVGCHQSKNAWPRLLARDTAAGVDGQAFVACSGAVLTDFYTVNTKWISTTQLETPQLEHVVPSATKLVTFTIGGNDVGFEKVLSACVVGPLAEGRIGCRNNTALNTIVDSNLKALRDGVVIVRDPHNPAKESTVIKKSLDDTFVEIAGRLAPGGRLVVGGYPRLFGPDRNKGYTKAGSQRSCVVLPGYEVLFEDAEWINRVDARGNEAIRQEIDEARGRIAALRPDVRIEYADAWTSFGNHSLCDRKDNWINGLQISTGGPKRQSFHPNGDGQKAYAAAFRTAMKR